MNQETLDRASRLGSRITQLARFVQDLEFAASTSRLGSSPFAISLVITPPASGSGTCFLANEYSALYDEFGPIILERLKVILAKWEAEFAAL